MLSQHDRTRKTETTRTDYRNCGVSLLPRALTKHYSKQKSQCSAYFRIRGEDLPKIFSSQYTLYDFVENAFAFSPSKRELAITALAALKKRPQSFSELRTALSAKKSSLYLVVLSLQRSGLVEPASGRSGVLRLSKNFSTTLSETSAWWLRWAFGQ